MNQTAGEIVYWVQIHCIVVGKKNYKRNPVEWSLLFLGNYLSLARCNEEISWKHAVKITGDQSQTHYPNISAVAVSFKKLIWFPLETWQDACLCASSSQDFFLYFIHWLVSLKLDRKAKISRAIQFPWSSWKQPP